MRLCPLPWPPHSLTQGAEDFRRLKEQAREAARPKTAGEARKRRRGIAFGSGAPALCAGTILSREPCPPAPLAVGGARLGQSDLLVCPSLANDHFDMA